jgi:predicted  nucleic acid-binding Zn-ribbon protein
MNPSIEALLDLRVIDQQRLALKGGREQRHQRLADADKTLAAAEAAAEAAAAEVDKLSALVRQYTADVARCDGTIAELRAKQMNAKTNKEYMAIINGVEGARLEKSMREQSVKDLATRVADYEAKVVAAKEQVEKARAKRDETRTTSGDTVQPTGEEAELQRRYDEIKQRIDPAFLEVYERLVKAHHKMPLMRVDPVTRSTPYGNLVSHNQIEQVRMGKLVVDRTSNAILFVEDTAKPAANAGKAD